MAEQAKTIYFFGSKEIGLECLKYLYGTSKNLGLELLGVLTNNRSLSPSDETIGSYCESKHIPVKEDLNSLLNSPQADYLISVQYHQILKRNHLDKARILAVNLHMAPLPEYRGCNQFSFAIANSEHEFGTTLHVMNEHTDSGDILFEERFPIPENYFVKDLYQITFRKSIELFKKRLQDIVDGNYKRTPQNKTDKMSRLYKRSDIDQLRLINAEWPVEKQKRVFRATYFPPYPLPLLRSSSGLLEVDIEWYKNL